MRLVLLSDLHFGRAQPDLVQPLLDRVAQAEPDLVVVAGDFVQRARAGQFAMARDFLQRLACDWIAVPGNHDIPLFNLPARLVAPRAAFRRWIAAETEPEVETDTARIMGLDTASRWHHQRGSIRSAQIARVCRALQDEAGRRTVVLIAHHPFHHRPDVEKKVMVGGAAALDRWSDCGPHVILSGHLHTWAVEPFVARKTRSMTLQVHCGTGLSTRLRGEPNDFAIIDLEEDRVVIRRLVAETGRHVFSEMSRSSYRRTQQGWRDGEAEGDTGRAERDTIA